MSALRATGAQSQSNDPHRVAPSQRSARSEDRTSRAGSCGAFTCCAFGRNVRRICARSGLFLRLAFPRNGWSAGRFFLSTRVGTRHFRIDRRRGGSTHRCAPRSPRVRCGSFASSLSRHGAGDPNDVPTIDLSEMYETTGRRLAVGCRGKPYDTSRRRLSTRRTVRAAIMGRWSSG